MKQQALDESLNSLDFESFKQADVYSFALVLWEIMRRCAGADGWWLKYKFFYLTKQLSFVFCEKKMLVNFFPRKKGTLIFFKS